MQLFKPDPADKLAALRPPGAEAKDPVHLQYRQVCAGQGSLGRRLRGPRGLDGTGPGAQRW